MTSTAAAWVVLIVWLASGPPYYFVATALFISAVGDGLAEPVGYFWGHNKYQVLALGTSRRYTRSLEGSACVFLSAVVGIFLFYPGLGYYPNSDFFEFPLSLILLPAIATFAEAKSPHTWDQPIILAACALTTSIVQISSPIAVSAIQAL